MKTQSKTMLAAAILGLIAFAGNTQAQTVATGTVAATPSATPDPRTGTYQDPKETPDQRISQALDVIKSGTAADKGLDAVKFIITSRPVIHAQKLAPDLADKVIADSTLGGTFDVPHPMLVAYAISFKADCITVPDDKIAFLKDGISNPNLDDAGVLALKLKLGDTSVIKAQKQLAAFDYDGAIATVTPILGQSSNFGDVGVMFKALLAKRDPQVLQYAKLSYFIKSFGATQDGIDAENSAFRAIDTSLVRMNQNVDFQKTGQGTNPFASVSLPKINFIAQNATCWAVDKAIAGDMVGALKIAVNQFASAPSGPKLNNATSFVAQWLRNIDGNFVRANAFIAAQTGGQTFTIAELQ